jgi:AcrR family transcriptional regulator
VTGGVASGSAAGAEAAGGGAGDRSRGPYAKGIAKREEILRTALAVFAESGPRGSSLRELADAAGLSQAGLLHYFDSKEELLVAILRARDEADARSFADEDAFGSLARIMQHNLDVPGLVELFAQLSVAAADPSHPGHSFFVERYRTLRSMIGRQIRAMQERGELDRSLDPESIATLLVAAEDGLQVQWMLDPGIDMAARVRDLWQLVTAARPDRS